MVWYGKMKGSTMKLRTRIAAVFCILFAGTCGIASGQSGYRGGVPRGGGVGPSSADRARENARLKQAALEDASRSVHAAEAANASVQAQQSQKDATNRAQILASQEVAKDKALKWNQEQAAKGDAYGLLRMGERYRDGNGVPRDLSKAREYFTKASAGGSPTSADALSKLNQVSTNSPARK
jgi:TPR repeat protein